MEAVGLSLDRLIITWSHLKASLSLIMIFIPVFFLLRLVVVSFASAENRTHSGPEILNFDYRQSSRQGPLFWHNVNTTGNEWEIYRNKPEINLDVPGNECKSTRRPSPINLVANAECSDRHEILTRRIKSTDCHFDSLAFSVTPHTLRADFPFDDSTCQRPTIDMPNGYPFTWFVHHIEVHLRAEHVLDGRRYDGEMQMYHLGREDQKRELAAVAVLLDASGLHDDPRLQQYIEAWKVAANETEIKCAAQRQLRTTRKTTSRRTPVQDKEFYLDHGKYSLHFFKSFNITRAVDHPEHSTRHLTEELDGWGPRRKMFPYDIWPTIHFYRYKGMITVPPCSEIVSWRVLDEPLVISKHQLRDMATLLRNYRNPDTCELATQTSGTGENVRPLQELNQEKQELVHCTSKDFTYRLYPPSLQ